MPNEPSFSGVGTAFIASSESEETKGIIITPITIPAARALSEATLKPTASPTSRINGATVNAAKKPYTTVGTPARISNIGLAKERNFAEAY